MRADTCGACGRATLTATLADSPWQSVTVDALPGEEGSIIGVQDDAARYLLPGERAAHPRRFRLHMFTCVKLPVRRR